MKKIIVLFVALLMIVSLCACSIKNNDYSNSEVHQLGDTIVTDNWEFTLSQVTFGTNLCKDLESKDYMMVDGDYKTTDTWGGETYDLAYVAEKDRAFVAVGYTMKYIGKKKIDVFDKWPDMKVVYNDGYIFEDSPYSDGSLYVWDGEKFEEVINPDIEPLSPETEYRDCFDVPIEVKENTTGSVNIIVDLGRDGTYSYVVR